ncbi:MAG TPA: hypothetical protein VLA12_01760, partial [Planctomycetaceae bacterium]|nr:hypothetical protein [Planctomycetaceae bacterium]
VALQAESAAPTGESSSGERSVEKFADAELDGIGVSETEGLGSLSFSAPEMEAMGSGEGAYLQVISPINLKETTEIGDIVRALRMSAGHVAIVELTVVDRQQGIDNLQFILSGLSIKDDPSVPRQKPDEGESAEELYTVFVEAAPAQMHAVLTKMQEEMEFATVEVSATIPADDLEPYFVSNGYAALGVNRARLWYQESLDESKSVELRGEIPAKPSPSKVDNPATPAIVTTDPKPASAGKDSKETTPAAPPLPENGDVSRYRFSRQATLWFPEKETIEFFEQNKLQRESAPAPDARRAIAADNLKKLAQPEPSPPAPEPAKDPATKPAEVAEKLDASPVPAELPLQVLFVLRLENAELPLPAPKPSAR